MLFGLKKKFGGGEIVKVGEGSTQHPRNKTLSKATLSWKEEQKWTKQNRTCHHLHYVNKDLAQQDLSPPISSSLQSGIQPAAKKTYKFSASSSVSSSMVLTITDLQGKYPTYTSPQMKLNIESSIEAELIQLVRPPPEVQISMHPPHSPSCLIMCTMDGPDMGQYFQTVSLPLQSWNDLLASLISAKTPPPHRPAASQLLLLPHQTCNPTPFSNCKIFGDSCRSKYPFPPKLQSSSGTRSVS